MFADDIPWVNVSSDIQVMFAVKQGKRPNLPTKEISLSRGLSDKTWEIIEACWAQDPNSRPNAEQIVENIRALPNRPPDLRPVDNFNIAFSSRIRYNLNAHPFSALATIAGNIGMDSTDTWMTHTLESPSFSSR